MFHQFTLLVVVSSIPIHHPVTKILIKETDYWYKAGFNWRAYAAYVMAIWPLCPGLAYQFTKDSSTSVGWRHLYQIGWLFAVTISSTIYIALNYIFPVPSMVEARKHSWEQYAENQRALFDKEETPEGVTIIEGAGSDADSSSDGNRHMEKELEKTPGQVTVV